MNLPAADRQILRELARHYAEAAADPVNVERAGLWRRLNDLEPVRPLVWINEEPWNELNTDDELTLRCADPWARGQEWGLRARLYQWRHYPGDMVLDDHLACPMVIHNSGYGLGEQVDIARTDPTSGVVSRHFHRQIVEPADLAKIKMPIVSHDAEATQANFERLSEVYDGLLPVKITGLKHIWYTPWDELIRWWGVQEAMMDLVDRPDMVNEAVARCAASMNCGLDQMVAQNLLSPGADNTRVGSGGYGYCSDLPAAGFDPQHCRPSDNWGCSNAQIFSEVSAAMHWEFALRHDIDWLARWGLNYYGCCEPLDRKIEILRRIPRLRKISMNFKIDPERAADALGSDFAFSYKPNPAPLAEDHWRPEICQEELRRVLERTRGCRVEIILKDISTVRYEPRRLWQWAALASEIAQEFAP
jgi:hypothetical protein